MPVAQRQQVTTPNPPRPATVAGGYGLITQIQTNKRTKDDRNYLCHHPAAPRQRNWPVNIPERRPEPEHHRNEIALLGQRRLLSQTWALCLQSALRSLCNVRQQVTARICP